ncbi:MAG TPA: nitroreductase/quinone reductase family protein [Solirubrobacterales bacterium]
MAGGDFKDALQDTTEVELTVTGRKTGRESSRPIWFTEEDEKLLLLPVGGSKSNWYRNLVKTPEVGLSADGAEVRANANPIEDPAGVADVLEKFRGKYGADQVEKFYPDQDAAVAVPLA